MLIITFEFRHNSPATQGPTQSGSVFNVSCYLKSDKIWILCLDLVGNSEADLEEGPWGPGSPRYFWTKLRSERSKKKI